MSATITYTACPVCQSPRISGALEVTDYTVSNNVFAVWHCTDCTARFTQYAPAEPYIGKFYQSQDYISHTDTRKGLINSLYHRVRKITLRSKARLVSGILRGKKGRLLDFGAGTGAFAATMRQQKWNVTGVEPDESARRVAEKKYGLNLLTPAQFTEQENQQFDIITLWHVLEHLHDLHGALNKFSQSLVPGGHLLIAVPNYTSYDARVYQQYWAAYDVPRHLYHFSPAAMRHLMTRHGFSITEQKPMWFDSFYVSMLSEQYKHGKSGLVRAVLTGMLSNLKALFIPATCSSVIYICKKDS